jgi:hypothetical protein
MLTSVQVGPVSSQYAPGSLWAQCSSTGRCYTLQRMPESTASDAPPQMHTSTLLPCWSAGRRLPLPCQVGVHTAHCGVRLCPADHAPVLQLNSGFRRKHGSSDVNHQSLGGECCTTNQCPGNILSHLSKGRYRLGLGNCGPSVQACVNSASTCYGCIMHRSVLKCISRAVLTDGLALAVATRKE